ncbi:MAG: DEAD/DEAH box helicase [Pseudomonadota bacterium]
MKFIDLDLDPKVLEAVAETGYETPTPIQAQAIPSALQGRDVLGIAQTGSGKTAAFTLPMISILAKGRARARMPRSLILCPTRELAAQVSENFETYGKNHKLTMALLIGGVSFKDQDKLIDRGVDVLIATPGRLLDHFERGKLMLTGVQVMVVDEADRMLDMGFIPDIEKIFGLTPFTRQTLFFSATMPPEITRITETFLHNPVRVEVAKQATTAETIEQVACKHRPARRDTADKEKRELLRQLIDGEGDALTNGIVFCNRKRDVDVVGKSLKKHGYNAAPLHGDLDQSLRMRTLDGFRNGEIRVLIASDVAARGLDIPTVSHVFNFDVPIHSEDYVHRIGRTGRAGRKGKAITLCFPHEQKHLDKIEELIGKPVPLVDSPMGGGAAEEAAATPAGEAQVRDGSGRDGSGREGASAPEADDKPKRGRSRRGGGRRKREEEASAAPAAEPAAMLDDPRGEAEAAPVEDAPVRREPSRGRERADRSERGDRSERAERGDRQDRGGRGGRRDRGPRVVGMGDHVPAFLMIEVPEWAKSLPAEAEDDDETPSRDRAA